MAVSTDFAPPFKLIAPYFIIGVVSFFISSVLLFGIDITSVSHTDAVTLSWAHTFLLSFVMMVIFGAMAQLVPVVLEKGHFAVDLYYIIYPLLFIGSTLMGYGFLFSAPVLPYGGLIVLISLLVFVFETFMTIKKVGKLNTVMKSVVIANTFLFFGLIFGIIMALGYAGVISVDIMRLLRGHIYLVLFGYVGVTTMGMSMILLPMFWLSHSFSWKPIKTALWLISLGVGFVVFSSILQSSVLEYIGYLLAMGAFFVYFYQIYLIYKTRVRLDNDIYLHSLLVSYISLIIALSLGIIYLIFPNPKILLAVGWILLLGFITFLIIGHLYKIVPFLVWYQRFSPLVGKQKVPMLADMVPHFSAKFQFGFNLTGASLGVFAILIGSDILFRATASFLVIGSIFAIKDIVYMINFKG